MEFDAWGGDVELDGDQEEVPTIPILTPSALNRPPTDRFRCFAQPDDELDRDGDERDFVIAKRKRFENPSFATTLPKMVTDEEEIARVQHEAFLAMKTMQSAEQMKNLFALNGRIGAVPCLSAYNMYIQKLTDEEAVDEIPGVLDTMTIEGVFPRLSTYTLAIKGLLLMPYCVPIAARLALDLSGMSTVVLPHKIWSDIFAELLKVVPPSPNRTSVATPDHTYILQAMYARLTQQTSGDNTASGTTSLSHMTSYCQRLVDFGLSQEAFAMFKEDLIAAVQSHQQQQQSALTDPDLVALVNALICSMSSGKYASTSTHKKLRQIILFSEQHQLPLHEEACVGIMRVASAESRQCDSKLDVFQYFMSMWARGMRSLRMIRVAASAVARRAPTSAKLTQGTPRLSAQCDPAGGLMVNPSAVAPASSYEQIQQILGGPPTQALVQRLVDAIESLGTSGTDISQLEQAMDSVVACGEAEEDVPALISLLHATAHLHNELRNMPSLVCRLVKVLSIRSAAPLMHYEKLYTNRAHFDTQVLPRTSVMAAQFNKAALKALLAPHLRPLEQGTTILDQTLSAYEEHPFLRNAARNSLFSSKDDTRAITNGKDEAYINVMDVHALVYVATAPLAEEGITKLINGYIKQGSGAAVVVGFDALAELHSSSLFTEEQKRQTTLLVAKWVRDAKWFALLPLSTCVQQHLQNAFTPCFPNIRDYLELDTKEWSAFIVASMKRHHTKVSIMTNGGAPVENAYRTAFELKPVIPIADVVKKLTQK